MSERQLRRGKEERRRKILDELRVHPSIRASEIAQRLGVHVETIRRDLDDLHEVGKISRTYGGALPAAMGFEASIAERDLILVDERRRIAERAVALVSAGDVLMIDVGSTTAHFARRLAARGCEVRVITNSCKILNLLGTSSQIRTLLCPGEYSFSQAGVAGPETTAFLKNFHADKLVFSVGGMTENGLYEVDPDFAWAKRAMITNARVRILLADHQKVGRAVMTKVCGFDVIDHLVTDREVNGPLLDQLGLAGVQIHLC